MFAVAAVAVVLWANTAAAACPGAQVLPLGGGKSFPEVDVADLASALAFGNASSWRVQTGMRLGGWDTLTVSSPPTSVYAWMATITDGGSVFAVLGPSKASVSLPGGDYAVTVDVTVSASVVAPLAFSTRAYVPQWSTCYAPVTPTTPCSTATVQAPWAQFSDYFGPTISFLASSTKGTALVTSVSAVLSSPGTVTASVQNGAGGWYAIGSASSGDSADESYPVTVTLTSFVPVDARGQLMLLEAGGGASLFMSTMFPSALPSQGGAAFGSGGQLPTGTPAAFVGSVGSIPPCTVSSPVSVQSAPSAAASGTKSSPPIQQSRMQFQLRDVRALGSVALYEVSDDDVSSLVFSELAVASDRARTPAVVFSVSGFSSAASWKNPDDPAWDALRGAIAHVVCCSTTPGLDPSLANLNAAGIRNAVTLSLATAHLVGSPADYVVGVATTANVSLLAEHVRTAIDALSGSRTPVVLSSFSRAWKSTVSIYADPGTDLGILSDAVADRASACMHAGTVKFAGAGDLRWASGGGGGAITPPRKQPVVTLAIASASTGVWSAIVAGTAAWNIMKRSANP